MTRPAGQRIRRVPLVVDDDDDPVGPRPSSDEIKAAVARLEWIAAQDSGASPGAQRVLDFCFRGGKGDTIGFMDLCRLDSGNTRAALLLLGLVATIKQTLPEALLSCTKAAR